MTPIEYVRETIDLVKQIETRFLELGARLYKIREEKLYIDTYSSFQEFLDAAHIKAGNASMLAKIHRVYVVEGGRTNQELAGIGYSNLYEAIPLIERDGFDATVIKAETLTRSEIIDEVKEQKHGVHEHTPKDDSRFAFCDCGKLIRVND
jgi:hypothetical protein